MQQAVMTQPGKIEFRQVEKPGVKADEVLIQVKRIGVCGSDIHVFHGLHPYTSYPVVQGHEIGGVVAETGADVRGFRGGRQGGVHAPGDLRRVLPLPARHVPHLR